MGTERVKGGEWLKELELFNLKDSVGLSGRTGNRHHLWCPRSSRQGPVDGRAAAVAAKEEELSNSRTGCHAAGELHHQRAARRRAGLPGDGVTG